MSQAPPPHASSHALAMPPMPHWDRLRAEEAARRKKQGHLTLHPAFAGLMAANDQDETWVCWLLQTSADGLTPLMKACMSPGAACARTLLPFESPKARDRHGMTALMFAAERSNHEACALLAPLSPLRARGTHGLDALDLAREPRCRDAILLAMAQKERQEIEAGVQEGTEGDRGSGSAKGRL